MFLRSGVCAALVLIAAPLLAAEPLSKSFTLDFFRDVPSRNLKGLATRSDGRLLLGPTFTDLTGSAPAELLWCLEPASEGKWLVGTGPDGKIFEFTTDLAHGSYAAHPVATLDEPQVFALKRLPDGALLAGTSPHGVLVLLREGKPVARVALPVDSIFDFAAIDAHTVLVATGNPGRIYRVDTTKFASAGIVTDKVTDAAALAAKGISLFGEIRDRNVRRLAIVADRVIAGSSPKGNVYAFAADGGAPVLLQENHDAEIAAFLSESNGDFYAAIVFASTPGESRINTRSSSGKSTGDVPPGDATPPPPPATIERFPGRSALVYFPKSGFPETVVGRSGIAFYALAQRGDVVLIAGGEQGDFVGYDVKQRQSLSFAGSASAQINQLVPLGKTGAGNDASTQFLALRNNAAGLALIDFAASGLREAETRRLDLTTPATLGAFRFNRLRGVDAGQLIVDLRTSLASDEAEGWSPWVAAGQHDDGWIANDARGRYVKARVRLKPGVAAAAQLDKASLFYLPQNHRPQLTEFRLISPNYALLPLPDLPSTPITTLGQLVGPERDRSDDKHKNGLLSSSIVPQPGAQIALWTVTDPDGDNLAYTFSIRRDGTDTWTDLAVNSHDSYVQFDISHLDDGVYTTRLVATEQAPRPPAERLSVTFETDDLVVDKTPPVLGDVKITRGADGLTVSVSGRDAMSLLDGAEFVFNNGYRKEVNQPADGVRDSQAETFTLTVPADKLAGATSVEVLLYDSIGNSAAKRVGL